ncbi:isoprenyl transferase [Ignavigranum ruoffiae]|uniref:Isoprenyl transferase n=1 Tax=Ignavigranum ruoffiae TaxID=89093 RepID=A0A1H8Z3B5_9LACT|nr:isoprenyl transferase [Ignavigranum ruoffiae]UPQ85461.1 isoprenyl transferase [Ignavigranum ruoffiae]SEP58747.1 undecaprenyl diphosphate synthase [Ignavigranum ruoffiae]
MNLQQQKMPQHVAMIMDGNGRWAKSRLMPRTVGHKAGVDTIKRIAIHAHKLGIKLLTLYAFSTENWGRPVEEVKYLMNLPQLFFKSFMPELMEHQVKVETIGNVQALPEATLEILEQAKAQTANNSGLILNFAINYGGQEELTQACRSLANQVQKGQLQPDQIDSMMIQNQLTTAKFGPLALPDLVIRTSGELRLSNFLLWQLAYSELYFTDTLWPDFREDDFDQALASYQQRQRRFGKVKESE